MCVRRSAVLKIHFEKSDTTLHNAAAAAVAAADGVALHSWRKHKCVMS